MSKYLTDILNKTGQPITRHLEAAIANGAVKEIYNPPAPKKVNESQSTYLNRIVRFATKPQFVQVATNGVAKYVAFGVSGPIITEHGKFLMVPAQVVGGVWGTHYFLIYPNLQELRDSENVLIRLDSGCFSGQILGDITCDCREQLEIGMGLCVENGSGIVIHMPNHDGRGWGEFKMANQQIMDELKVDTVEAARLFYGDETAIDQRTYDEAIMILQALGFKNHTFCLATNNPRKISAFNAAGMHIKTTKEVVAKNMNGHVKKNLKAKSKHWNHAVTHEALK